MNHTVTTKSDIHECLYCHLQIEDLEPHRGKPCPVRLHELYTPAYKGDDKIHHPHQFASLNFRTEFWEYVLALDKVREEVTTDYDV